MAEQGSSRLFRMLADLSEDPEKLERFKNPDTRQSVVDEYGLSAEQSDLLEKSLDEKRHDLERYSHLSKLVGDEAEKLDVPLC